MGIAAQGMTPLVRFVEQTKRRWMSCWEWEMQERDEGACFCPTKSTFEGGRWFKAPVFLAPDPCHLVPPTLGNLQTNSNEKAPRVAGTTPTVAQLWAQTPVQPKQRIIDVLPPKARHASGIGDKGMTQVLGGIGKNKVQAVCLPPKWFSQKVQSPGNQAVR